MKFPFIILLIIIPFHSFCQKGRTNKINKVSELKIYGGNNKIEIGKVVVNNSIETKVYFIKSESYLDSSGEYCTTLYLGNNENLPLFNSQIIINFNDPVISVDGMPEGSGMEISTSLNNTKTKFEFKASQINRPYKGNILISIIIKSKKPPFFTLSGVDGRFH